MAARPGDPLLGITLAVTRLVAALLALATIAVIIALGFIAFDMLSGTGALIGEYPGVEPTAVFSAVWTLLPLAGIGFALGAVFMQLLARIVGSVAQGDPFDVANARRLNRMGWLALGFELIAIPVRIANAGLNDLSAGGAGHYELRLDDIGLGGFVLALVLFVLARVFAKGAGMRDDLEGTV